LLEPHSFDLGEDIDAGRRLPHLEPRPGRRQAALVQVAERRSDRGERRDDLASVLFARFDPHVEILGGPGLPWIPTA